MTDQTRDSGLTTGVREQIERMDRELSVFRGSDKHSPEVGLPLSTDTPTTENATNSKKTRKQTAILLAANAWTAILLASLLASAAWTTILLASAAWTGHHRAKNGTVKHTVATKPPYHGFDSMLREELRARSHAREQVELKMRSTGGRDSLRETNPCFPVACPPRFQ